VIFDVFYAVISCRFFLNNDFDDYIYFNEIKIILNEVNDLLDIIIALIILHLFCYYLMKKRDEILAMYGKKVEGVVAKDDSSKKTLAQLKDLNLFKKAKKKAGTHDPADTSGSQLEYEEKQELCESFKEALLKENQP
jgi:hypothetical protein